MVDKFTSDDLLALLKTAREVALKKSEVDAKDIAKELVKAIREEVVGFEAQIVQMRKLEQTALQKSLHGLPSVTPSVSEVKKSEFKPTCKMCKTQMSPVEYVTSRPTGNCKKCAGGCMKKDELGFKFNPTQTPAQAKVTQVAKPTTQQVAQTNSKLVSPSYQIKSELQKDSMPMSNPGTTPSVIPGQPNAPQAALTKTVFGGGQLKTAPTVVPVPGAGSSGVFSNTVIGGPVSSPSSAPIAHDMSRKIAVQQSGAEFPKTDFGAQAKQNLKVLNSPNPQIRGPAQEKLLASSEPVIDKAHAADPEKREKEHNPNPKAVLPTDKKSKKIPAEGSGGELVKQVMPSTKQTPVNIKPPAPSVTPPPAAGALKPEGIAGAKAGEAPSAPKPPSAPGSVGSTLKSSELEKGVLQDQKANAAFASGQAAAGQDTGLGGWMYQHSPGKSPAIARAQAGKVSAVKPPSMEEHAARAGSLSDFMPEGKFTQAGSSVPVTGSVRAGPKPAPTVPVKSTIKPIK